MRKNLERLLEDVVMQIAGQPVSVDVTLSPDPARGEYASNIAMRLSGQLKKPPMEIALQVKQAIEASKSAVSRNTPDHIKQQTGQKLSSNARHDEVLQAIERVELAAPGFLNVVVTEANLSTQVSRVLNERERFGTSQTGKGKRVMVEYTDPNPFKELHIGHLYSNAVGESLARLHEANGWSVVRADYFGDVGMHVAKSIWGLRKKMSEDRLTLEDLAKQTLSYRVKYLGAAYSVGASVYEESTEEALNAKEEMKDINYMVYLAAQEYMQKKLHWTPQIDYKKYVNVDSGLYAEIQSAFETGRSWSMEYFEGIFRRLGTRFDEYYPESIVGEYGVKLVHEHIGDVFEESDGAVVFRGRHTRVFLNSLGLPTYEAKELGLEWKKFEDHPLDRSLIVTGNEINEYFKVLFEVMNRILPDVASKSTHIGHGMVRLPEGKMSSRTGKIISGEGLLDDVKSSIYKILDTSHTDYTKTDREEIAEKAAIAAVKYAFLRVALPANIAFDFDTSLSFDGDSGPYLLYTYARCRSVLRKSGQPATGPIPTMNAEERLLARQIAFFPDIVTDAADSLSPNVLCTYLFKLAQTFNLLYQKHAIAGDPRRLALTDAASQTLKNGLSLLGISTVERM